MAMTKQQIYEEALRRAGISTSPIPLTIPGFPETLEAYERLILYPSEKARFMDMVHRGQFSRFELEMHNMLQQQKNEILAAASKAAAVKEKQTAEVAVIAEYQSLCPDELALYKEFREAQLAKKREEEAAVARAAAIAAAAKEEERVEAMRLFREILQTAANTWYLDDETQILRNGKHMKEIGPGGLGWPHGLLKMWREKRYKGKIEWRNYTHSICDGGWSPAKDGFDWDGWPLADEADAEAAKLLSDEWKMFLNFCLRYVERKEKA